MMRFPAVDVTGEQSNVAIELYGRRFYNDQTPLEYLAEFLLVYASPKGADLAAQGGTAHDNAFSFSIGDGSDKPLYWPKDGAALKLFSFFPGSKLDTRHQSHMLAYREALNDLEQRIDGDKAARDETVRLLQGLFAGFIGVAKNRTWATQTFFPATESLLSRELDWLHSKASRDGNVTDWDTARKYFATDRHNFLARGGELLFLQLAHLFSVLKVPSDLADNADAYAHAIKGCEVATLKTELEEALRLVLQEAASPLEQLIAFVGLDHRSVQNRTNRM